MAAPTISGRSSWETELGLLKPGWDGYDGKPIAKAAIATVGSFATVPTSEGGIQLEIHQDGFDIEIVIGADGKINSALIARDS